MADPASALRLARTSLGDAAAAGLAKAEQLLRERQPAPALSELDALPEIARASEAAIALRAAALGALGRQEEETALLTGLVESSRDPNRYRLRLGHALRALGRTDDAKAAYRAILEARPGDGTAWWSLANLKSFAFGDDDIAAMKKALKRSKQPPANRIHLHFALGKAHEDRSQAEAAFRHYDQGNRLRRAERPYDPASIRRSVDRSVSLFTRDFLEERQQDGCQARDPIFIVGMQRSGSTLVEQILACHPQIEGTAELTTMPTISKEIGAAAMKRKLSFEQYLRQMPAKELRELGERYIARTRSLRRTDKPHFTDKMPNNWMLVGLIRVILPNAKIIDVRRHPLACGFSNWKQLYGSGLEHSSALDSMGLYYAEYVRLLRHFDDVQPGTVYRLIYERLVENVEGAVRRLLDYLGLPFDPTMLDFHRSERPVQTISATQVRRPINRDGLDHWRAFEQWLGPLRQGLGTALQDWDRE